MKIFHELHKEALSSHLRVVWVEDETTKEVLQTLFGDGDAKWNFHVAGGWHGVDLIVKDAVKNGYNILGIIDKDFRTDLSESGDNNIFILPRHEIENFLLDPDAIAQSRNARPTVTAGGVKDGILKRAKELKYTEGVNATLFKANPAFFRNFLQQTNKTFESIEEAIEFITTHDKWADFCNYCQKFSNNDTMREEIATFIEHVGQIEWGNSKWLDEFEGKLLLKAAKAVTWRQLPDGSTSKENQDLDFAKSISEAIVETNGIPEDLSNLMKQIEEKASQGS